MRSEKEIQDMADKAADVEGTKFHAMTYEQGIGAALEWVLGYEDGDPVEGT